MVADFCSEISLRILNRELFQQSQSWKEFLPFSRFKLLEFLPRNVEETPHQGTNATHSDRGAVTVTDIH